MNQHKSLPRRQLYQLLIDFFMTMAWILQAVGGGESIGVYIKDVKGGNKTFVRTMIGATIAVGIMYILGAVAVGLVVPTDVLKETFQMVFLISLKF